MSNSVFKKICITLGALILIIVAATIIVLIQADNLKKQQIFNFENELRQELSNDDYMENVLAGEVSVTVQVKDSYLQLSNRDKLDKINEYINLATGVRAKYDRINDGNYVCVHIYSSNGVELVKSNQKGQSKIIKD